MEATGQDSQGAPGHQEGGEEAGLEEAPTPGPGDSDRQSGEEGGGTPPGGAAGGGAAAGPEAGSPGEGRGQTDGAADRGKPPGSESGQEAGKPEDGASGPGDQQPATSGAESWERSQGRLPEREGTELGEGQDPLEEKPGLQKTARPVRTQESEFFREKEPAAGRDAEPQVRRPTIRFSIGPRPVPQPPWSGLGRTSPSVYNQLAKMGDPDVLEMMQQEGASRRSGARGGSDTARGPPTAGVGPPGTLAALAARSSGTFAEWRAPREAGTARRTDPARRRWVGGVGAL